jgi:hypothetical protein
VTAIRKFQALALLFLCSCGHSDIFVSPNVLVGPVTNGPDVPLTFNSDQNYWPAWTEDGKGVLYAFVDPASPRHRCVGLLPAAGGTRTWQLCDNRASRADSFTSYPAFALDTTGRLLLLDAVTAIGNSGVPTSQLWLSDTAQPFVRRSVLSLPTTVTAPDGTSFTVTWLADLKWTGSETFLALAQQFATTPHCVDLLLGGKAATQCLTIDTLFSRGYVVQGALNEQGATLTVVSGTAGATDYSLAEGGRSIVFAVGAAIDRVPVGGAASPTQITPASWGMPVFGVGCRGTTCIIARDSVRIAIPGAIPITNFYLDPFEFSVAIAPIELRRISLTTGADELLQTNNNLAALATPVVSTQTGDVIVQVGGTWGHIQTFASVGVGQTIVDIRHSVLHLLKGLAR